jgi:hypothetical protein
LIEPRQSVWNGETPWSSHMLYIGEPDRHWDSQSLMQQILTTCSLDLVVDLGIMRITVNSMYMNVHCDDSPST